MAGSSVLLSEEDQQPRVEPFSEGAFEQFHGATFARLWSFARRVAGGEDEAHDVCQKAYLATWRYWSAGRLREDPRRLLFRSAKAAAIDAIRSRERRRRLLASTPVSDQSAIWLGIDLRDALRRLRAEDRALLLLQAAAGLSYAELAATERQSVAAIRSRLHRARRELRGHLSRT